MPTDLRHEIGQGDPFASLEQEAHLNVCRTAAVLQDAFEQMVKPHGVSGTQSNVLRILRGAGPDGLCRNEVRSRLISRMPDTTRLLDHMEEAGLVKRERSTSDRRLVTTRLTEQGRKLIDSLDDAIIEEHRERLGHMTREQLRTLIDLLTLARQPG